MSEESNRDERKRVLVVEDDPTVQTLVKAILTKSGYDVAVSDTATEGEAFAKNGGYDIIVLDLRLPDGNGYDICYNIRNGGISTPVLFLSAVHETDVKIKCLKVGADDYLTKPFNGEELIARIEAITRRSSTRGVESELRCGEVIKVNLVKRDVLVNGSEVSLTNNEFNLLVYFMKNRNRVISQEELAKNVWDIHFDTQTNYINVYISYLRKKIREKAEGDFIETVRKKGFIFNCPEESAE